MKKLSEFEVFFKENYSSLFYYALRLIDDEEASRDIVADGFEYAWKNFGNEDVQNWQAYIHAYIRNKCIDYIRHVLVKEKYANFYMQYMTEEDIQDEENNERIEAIRDALRSLPPRTQLILQECYLNEKKYKEVADELEISINAVKQHIVKALKSIREKIKKKSTSND